MRVPLDLLVKAGMWDLVRDAMPLTATAKIEQAKALERHGEQVQASASAEDWAMAEFMAEHFPTEQVAAGASVLVGRHRRPTDAQLAAAIGAVGEVDHAALDLPPEAAGADWLTRPTRPGSDGVTCA